MPQPEFNVDFSKFPYLPESIDYDGFTECPIDYKNYVIRIISMQAYAELMGANQVGYQLKLAPNYKARKGLAKIVYEEANHAYYLYAILDKLGISEIEAINIAEGKQLGFSKSSSLDGVISVADDKNCWLDIVLNNFLMDRAGGFMVNNFATSSFKPWAEACKKIAKDERWHVFFGLKQFEYYLESSSLENAKPSFRDWYIKALNFFGPPSIKSASILKIYGIKRQSNEELREAFIQEIHLLLNKNNWITLLPTISREYPFKIR